MCSVGIMGVGSPRGSRSFSSSLSAQYIPGRCGRCAGHAPCTCVGLPDGMDGVLYEAQLSLLLGLTEWRCTYLLGCLVFTHFADGGDAELLVRGYGCLSSEDNGEAFPLYYSHEESFLDGGRAGRGSSPTAQWVVWRPRWGVSQPPLYPEVPPWVWRFWREVTPLLQELGR